MTPIPDARPMSYSRGEISTLVMPHMANMLGDLFGGNLMAMVDQAASIAAIRHSGSRVVTASIHQVDFRSRTPIGSLVTCRSTVDYVGTSSMDITVEVHAEIPSTGATMHTMTAHLVFVAIDENGRPQRVPRLIAGTDEERGRYAAAERYRQESRAR